MTIAVATPLTLTGCSAITGIAGGNSVNAETVEVAGPAATIVKGALRQVGTTTGYDPSYVSIGYPNGDVAPETGVCSDVVVRAFRHAGIDLQRLLHEDMTANFVAYPQRWELLRPDPNIDHRRVPNLSAFFTRRGGSLPVTEVGDDYLPGDIVTWSIDGSPHTGVVSNKRRPGDDHFLIVNNRGSGAKVEDVLFAWKITGHFRWFA